MEETVGVVDRLSPETGQTGSRNAVAETKAEFESLVDAVEEYAIFRLDPDGTVISWNEGAAEIKGYEPAEILGRSFETFYTDADREAGIPEGNLGMADARGSFRDEGWRLRKDGTRFRANVTITPVYDDDGTHRGYLKVTRDMTDRYERERELEDELQRILGRVSDGFYALDESWAFTHANERAERLLGRSGGELLGRSIWDAFTELRGTAFEERFRTAMTDQEQTTFEAYYPPSDVWLETHAYPSETGLSVYFRDITERRRRQRELEESQRRYRALVDNFPNGAVALFDADLRYTVAGGELFEELAVDGDDLVGEHVGGNHAAALFADHTDRFHAALDGEPSRFEVSLSTHELVVHTLPLRDADGDVHTGMVMAQDITEREEYERKLEATNERLETSNERLEKFAYAASHDLREPLRMVSSYLQLIEQRYADELDEDGEEFIEFAVDGADRMSDMIEALLQYSRVETRGDSFEPTDLNELVEEVRADLRLRLGEADATITVDDLPAVRADPDQLRQVFQNLIDNGVEYSGDAPPSMHVSAERAGDRVVVAVADEGIGIGEDGQERVFDVFERLHTRDEHPGTGIGLALCRRIIERHNGEMWVDSEPGAGATFSFTLPAAE
ncbi:PAS domain-containing sensor histidine kinase [Halorubrum gandharaense]